MRDEDEKIMEEIRTMCLEILESQKAMANVPSDIAIIKNDMEQIKSDNLAIKAVNRSESTKLDDHERRITDLEAI